MRVLFLSISPVWQIEQRGIYTDLLRKFRNEGVEVYVVTPAERRFGLKTQLEQIDGVNILKVRTLNVQHINLIEKGIATLLLEWQFKRAIKRFLSGISFDLILYTTPPITLGSVIDYLKRQNPNAISYLLLKDIFPQNAVDLGMFSKHNPIYHIFRRKEIALYRRSDYIGCMSAANVDYLLKHNDFISRERVEVAPNSIELASADVNFDRADVRRSYGLPVDKLIFIYGGNLGRPQGIPFLVECLEANANREDCHFLIVGGGTEFPKLNEWCNRNKFENVTLLKHLAKNNYDKLVRSCDVGLIFLDYRFTIPNYPSRLLSYLEYKMPIIAATDCATDIGRIAEANGYGYWCPSCNVETFTQCVDRYVDNPQLVAEMGSAGYVFLTENYLVENTYNAIVNHLKT